MQSLQEFSVIFLYDIRNKCIQEYTIKNTVFEKNTIYVFLNSLFI